MPTKAKRKLSLSPQNLTNDSWYYETRKGLEIINYRKNESGNHERNPDRIVIPWRKVLESVRRYTCKP